MEFLSTANMFEPGPRDHLSTNTTVVITLNFGVFNILHHKKATISSCEYCFRLNVSSSEGRGQAPAHLMSCIAQSCSNLEIFDLSNLSSLSPGVCQVVFGDRISRY
jgi:hypothetical protein